MPPSNALSLLWVAEVMVLPLLLTSLLTRSIRPLSLGLACSPSMCHQPFALRQHGEPVAQAAWDLLLPPPCHPFLLQARGADSPAVGAAPTAAVAPDTMCEGPQQQHKGLSEVPEAATASAHHLQGFHSIPDQLGQLTAGPAGAQHPQQADTESAAAAAAAAVAAERPVDMTQELQALLVQLAGQLDAAHH